MKILFCLILLVASISNSATLKDQVLAQGQGTWTKLTTENLWSSVDPGPGPWNGNTGFKGLWTAWNSGAFKPDLGACGSIVYFGGGHNDYWGNEIITLDLCGAADGGMKWVRFTENFKGPITWPAVNGIWPDGTPSVGHDFDGLVMAGDKMIIASTQVDNTPTKSKCAMSFDFKTKKWSGCILNQGGQEFTSAYDTKRKLVFFSPSVASTAQAFLLNPETNEISYHGKWTDGTVNKAGAIAGYDPDHDRYVITGFKGTPATIAERDPANIDKPWVKATQVNPPAAYAFQHAMAWSDLRHAFIIWMDVLNDGKVYEVKRTNVVNGIPEYTWTLLTSTTNTVMPTTTAHNGSYKKMQLVQIAPGVEAFVGMVIPKDGLLSFRLPTVALPSPVEPPPVVVPPTCIPLEYKGLPMCTDPTAPPPVVTPPPVTAKPKACGAPGVFVCDDFETALTGTIQPNPTIPALKPKMENGNLVFTIPALSPANAGGSYFQKLPGIGEGNTLAFYYRIWADDAALALPGRKEFIAWRGASSCTDFQLVQTHNASRWFNLLVPYTECGDQSFNKAIPNDILMHYPDYYCTFQKAKLSLDGCAISHPNQWENIYIEFTVGHLGMPDSKVVMWHKTDGGTWKRYIERTDFTFRGTGKMENFILTVYMTGKDATVSHPVGTVKYSELIMSTQGFKSFLD